MTKVLIPLAEGFEEMEAVIPIDIFRRAGWTVTVAGLTGTTVTASRGVKILADTIWAGLDTSSFDLLVLPGGGEGSRALAADARILSAVRKFAGTDRIVAAICAAPIALQAAGVLKGRRATSHPSVRNDLDVREYLEDRVVIDDRIVTSRGAGTAFDFALALVRLVDGSAKADSIASSILL